MTGVQTCALRSWEQSVLLMLMRLIYLIFRDRLSIQQQISASCRNALEKLPIKRNKEILENIISLGMMDKYTKITNECECNKRSGKNESI